jgi:hypothetical protein
MENYELLNFFVFENFGLACFTNENIACTCLKSADSSG